MPVDDLPRHGGDLAAATRRYGEPRAGWLDLSTGVNPRPYPLPALDPACWTRLPDSAAETALRRAAAAAFGSGGETVVVAAPGTQALIQWLPRLEPPSPSSTVAVLSPTYAEHAAAWAAAGHRVMDVAHLDAAPTADVVVVVTPNNPDGRIVPAGDLAATAARTRLLVVDEAFADPLSAAASPGPGGGRMVALRSFGKFFGLPGLRLGFALTDPVTAETLRAAMGPWPVAGPALAVATVALADRAWIEDTRRWLDGMAGRLDQALSAAGLEVVGGTPLFRLARVPGNGASALHDRLARRGILVRAFTWSADRLRFGLPADEAGLARLSAALR
ncbi:MAG: threonine-phosphate decarboxylase CobD [Alphaproteobacteria bacterium]